MTLLQRFQKNLSNVPHIFHEAQHQFILWLQHFGVPVLAVIAFVTSLLFVSIDSPQAHNSSVFGVFDGKATMTATLVSSTATSPPTFTSTPTLKPTFPPSPTPTEILSNEERTAKLKVKLVLKGNVAVDDEVVTWMLEAIEAQQNYLCNLSKLEKEQPTATPVATSSAVPTPIAAEIYLDLCTFVPVTLTIGDQTSSPDHCMAGMSNGEYFINMNMPKCHPEIKHQEIKNQGDTVLRRQTCGSTGNEYFNTVQYSLGVNTKELLYSVMGVDWVEGAAEWFAWHACIMAGSVEPEMRYAPPTARPKLKVAIDMKNSGFDDGVKVQYGWWWMDYLAKHEKKSEIDIIKIFYLVGTGETRPQAIMDVYGKTEEDLYKRAIDFMPIDN